MPLIHISLRAGKPEAYRQAIFDSLYRAMREALNVVEDDQFMTITELPADFRYGSGYGVARSADVVYIQITVFNTRTVEQKKALFGAWQSCSAKALAFARRTCSCSFSRPRKRIGPSATASRNLLEAMRCS